MKNLWNRNYIFLLLISFCSGMTAQLVNTAMPLYLVNGLNATTSFSGILAACYTLVASFSRPICGRIVDKHGRKPMLIVGLLLFGIGALLFGMSSAVITLLLFRFIQGLGFGFSSTASSAACVDNIPAEHLGRGLGYFGIAGTLTQFIGPVLAVSLIISTNYFPPFATACVACLFATALTLFTTDVINSTPKSASTSTESASFRGIWKYIEKRSLFPSLIQLVISFSISCYMIYGALFAQFKGYDNIRIFFILSATGVLLARLVISRFVDKVHEFAFVIPASLLCGLSCLTNALINTPNVFLICGLLYGFSLGTMQPALNSMALRGIESTRRGAASGTFMFGFDGGLGLGALIWGVMADYHSYNSIYIAASVLLFAVAVVCAIYLCRKKTPTINCDINPRM